VWHKCGARHESKRQEGFYAVEPIGSKYAATSTGKIHISRLGSCPKARVIEVLQEMHRSLIFGVVLRLQVLPKWLFIFMCPRPMHSSTQGSKTTEESLRIKKESNLRLSYHF
jgi:hypothetical protein